MLGGGGGRPAGGATTPTTTTTTTTTTGSPVWVLTNSVTVQLLITRKQMTMTATTEIRGSNEQESKTNKQASK